MTAPTIKELLAWIDDTIKLMEGGAVLYEKFSKDTHSAHLILSAGHYRHKAKKGRQDIAYLAAIRERLSKQEEP